MNINLFHTTLLTLIATVPFTASALPQNDEPTTVEGSEIRNVQNGNSINATGGSKVNTGVQIRGGVVKDSSISNVFSGTVNASKSTVEVGTNLDGATIRNSDISTSTSSNITANHASVKTGVNISEARNADLKSAFSGDIDAQGTSVNAGTISGKARNVDITTSITQDIDATGKNIRIGTVTTGGGNDHKPSGGNRVIGGAPTASIGNVTSTSSIVQDIDVTVGGGASNVADKVKARNMSNVYKDGVSPDNTKHVYVTAAQKAKVLKKGGSVGDVSVDNSTRGGKDGKGQPVKNVKVFVE